MNEFDVRGKFNHYYDGVYEIEQIAIVEDDLFYEFYKFLVRSEQDEFILTANLTGIEKFEKLFEIRADPLTETIQFRRDRLLNRFSLLPPFTKWFLKEKLDILIGEGNYELEINYNDYTIWLSSSATDQKWYHEIRVTINIVKPCNMIFINRPVVSSHIDVGEEVDQAKVSWMYILDDWELGEYPFITYDEKGIIKMANTPSVTPEFLSDVAHFSVLDVVKARVNGTKEFTEFLTQINEGNVGILEYEVPFEAGTEDIRTLELFNAAGELLSYSEVYVPNMEGGLVRHKFIFEEREDI